MNHNKHSSKYLVIGLGLIATMILPMVEVNAAEHEVVEEGARPKYAVGLFLGYTRVHGENEPTLGFEAGFNINNKWSAGAVLEQTNRGRDTTLILLGVGYHPTEKLRLQIGLGRKDPSDKEENVLRLGLAYEFELANEWFIKPYAAYDFIQNEDGEPVVGFYFGRAF